jgi:hypothetical protein
VVLVIDPELEQWIWQDSIHVETALNHVAPPSLRASLQATGEWPASQMKPSDPKGSLERIVREKLHGNRSSSLYSKITSRVSVTYCQDAEFRMLRQQLQVWFP